MTWFPTVSSRKRSRHLPRQRALRAQGRRTCAALTFLGCLALAGCGFHPLYGGGKVAPQLASIYVEPVAERDGYELRNQLIDLLGSDGREAGKAYRLKLTLERSVERRRAAERRHHHPLQ